MVAISSAPADVLVLAPDRSAWITGIVLDLTGGVLA
jgi:hypothetical protein